MALQQDVMGGGASAVLTRGIIGTIQRDVVAAGTTQQDATGLGCAINVVTTVPSGAGVKLPTTFDSDYVLVKNEGANTLKIYPVVGKRINALSINASIDLVAGTTAAFWSIGDTCHSSEPAALSGGSQTITGNLTVSGTLAVGGTGTHDGRVTLRRSLIDLSSSDSQLVTSKTTGGLATMGATADGTFNQRLINVQANAKQNTGTTNLGQLTGTWVELNRNLETGLDQNGTVTTIQGLNVSAGHWNIDAITPLTTNVRVLNVQMNAKSGTITNAFGVRIAVDFTGGTVTNAWGFYADSTALNHHLGGNLLMGSTTPTAGAEKLQITGAGFSNTAFRVGSSNVSQYAAAPAIPGLQVVGSTANLTSFVQARFSGDTTGPLHVFAKSRNATPGSKTIVNSGDSLGRIDWVGDDGVDYDSIAARINAAVDGTPGAGDMPGRLEFYTTADAADTPTERMRIVASGEVYINATAATAGNERLQINGSLSINSNTLLRTYTTFTNGAGAGAGTLTNAPAAGNPTKWIPINDNGTTRHIPAW